MKLNQVLAAALVAAASVPAVASIALPGTGNGELFLVVWDQVDRVSYVKDLGIAMDSFNGNADLSFALGDANFLGFLGIANTTVSDLRFAVMAGDVVGSGTAAPRRMFTTVDSVTTALGNQSLTNAASNMETFASYQVTASLHTTHAGTAAVNGTSYDSVGNLAYFLNANGPTLNNAIVGWTNGNLVGTSSVFRSFSQNGTSGGGVTFKSDFAGVWGVTQSAGAYSATYSVAAVPEADGILMALAGFGAIGFVARRRRLG